MFEKKRVFTVVVKGDEGEVHPGSVSEVDSLPAARHDVFNYVSGGKIRAAYAVVADKDGMIQQTHKVSIHSDRNGTWEDDTRITPSQVNDAVTNYIRTEAAAAKQADSV